GEDFLTGPDRQRADAAGQQITPVPGLASTTAAGLLRRALAALPPRVRTSDRVAMRADAGYFENVFRDSKLGAALRHLPSGYPQVNLAWMWGALLAATMAAWLHQLTAITADEDIVAGHGVRGGKAMIATLRWRLIAVPGRLIRHARHLVLRLPPGHYLLPEVLARLRQLPALA
ncbi:MAG TPA: hypothetical protein VFQ68_07870, partial [Streptosporangiaceae bacterium]|nr:hypothetical protein [Streptosporangiaceae bacterium]